MELIKKHGLIIFLFFVFFIFYKPIFCFIIGGILIFNYGCSILIFLSYIKKHGIETIGKILSYESDEEGYKTPIIEFKTLEGISLTKKPYYYASTDLSRFRTYKNNVNQNVTIIYSLKNPEKFVIKTEQNLN